MKSPDDIRELINRIDGVIARHDLQKSQAEREKILDESKRLNAETKASRLQRMSARVDQGIRDGRLNSSRRESLITRAMADETFLDELLPKIP